MKSKKQKKLAWLTAPVKNSYLGSKQENFEIQNRTNHEIKKTKKSWRGWLHRLRTHIWDQNRKTKKFRAANLENIKTAKIRTSEKLGETIKGWDKEFRYFYSIHKKISNALPISLRVCLNFISGYVCSITHSICYQRMSIRQYAFLKIS